MKNCQNCNKEFKDLHETRGEAQKYCSIKCRQRAAHQRMKQKFIQEALNEEKNIITKNIEIEQEIITNDNINKQQKMTAINRLLNWLEENKELKISTEHIKLQAQVFALEESLNINYFESVTNIFNKKSNKNESEKSRY
jgi:hypothetical protein